MTKAKKSSKKTPKAAKKSKQVLIVKTRPTEKELSKATKKVIKKYRDALKNLVNR